MQRYVGNWGAVQSGLEIDAFTLPRFRNALKVKIPGFVRFECSLIDRLTGEPPRTFVQAAIRFNEIGQALISRFCFSGVSQHARPFAAGLC
jgi:hypothetical protein